MDKAQTRQTIKDLTAAIDTIKELGWTQKTFQNEDCEVCAIGAINVACGTDAFRCSNTSVNRDRRIRNAALEVQDTLKGRTVYRWNDEAGRTKRQVIGAFRRTINRLKKELDAA